MINLQNQAIISALEAKIDSLESAVARPSTPSESENEIEKSCQQVTESKLNGSNLAHLKNS